MTDAAALARWLRDEIVRLLQEEIDKNGSGDDLLPSVEAIEEDGVIKAMVIDEDANCFRVTVELI